MEQNDIKIVNFLWRMSWYCLVKCSIRTSVKMYGPTTHSAIVKNITKCFGCLSLSLTYVLSLNRHWSIVWSMTVCKMLDQPSFRRRLISSISHTEFNRRAPVALPRFCNLRAKVWNVTKSQVARYNCSPTSRDKVARWLCVHGALARYTFKT